MAGELDRATLRQLAEAKAADARLLLENGRWPNSYYLFGYAVELGFKAIIARGFRAEVIPDKRFVLDIYTHDLDDLLKASGLKEQLDQDKGQSRELEANWAVVSQWSEASRYEIVDQARAEAMGEAVTDQNSGLLEWLRTYW